MLLLTTLALLLTGLGLFATSQASLRRRLGAPALSCAGRIHRRLPAAALLVAAAWPAVAALGPGLGVIFWLTAMGLAGLLIAAVGGHRVSHRMRRLRRTSGQAR